MAAPEHQYYGLTLDAYVDDGAEPYFAWWGADVAQAVYVQQSAEGEQTSYADIDQATPSINQRATGSETSRAEAAQVAPAARQAADAGENNVPGDAAQVVPAVTQAAEGDVDNRAMVAQQAPAATQDASGINFIHMEAAQSLATLTCEADGAYRSMYDSISWELDIGLQADWEIESGMSAHWEIER